MPRSPQWMDLYEIWFRVSSRGHNQLCGVLLQSAHGFRFCEGSKFAISHWLGRSPLTQCWRYRAACEEAIIGYMVRPIHASNSRTQSRRTLKVGTEMSRNWRGTFKARCNRFYELPAYFHASHLSEIYEKLYNVCNSSVDFSDKHCILYI